MTVTPISGNRFWYAKHWGPFSSIVERRMEDGTTPLAILVFPPTTKGPNRAAREFWTYATNGMSARRMPCKNEPHGDPRFRFELIAYATKEEAWLIDLLTEMACYPFVYGSGFAIGHTLPVQPENAFLWSGYLLLNPRFEGEEFNPLPIECGLNGDWIFYSQVFGLLEVELQMAIQQGGPAITDQLPSAGSCDFLNLRRKPLNFRSRA